MESDFLLKKKSRKPRDIILRRLARLGVPKEYLETLYPGLVAFVTDKGFPIAEIVSAMLPIDEEDEEVFPELSSRGHKELRSSVLREYFRECMAWVKWLMFLDSPVRVLKNLSSAGGGGGGVCGAVWGSGDLAYRCRTCENDPTCAICVPCFRSGSHAGHDYAVIYTGGGCCDCGDPTAWRRDGFCSEHGGPDRVRPLPKELAGSAGPVLHALLGYWKGKLESMPALSNGAARVYGLHIDFQEIVLNDLTFVVVEMLLQFCKYSEGLLCFVAEELISFSGLLGMLVEAEGFLLDDVSDKLSELLLKFLGDPAFKLEFAKVYLHYYPLITQKAIADDAPHIPKRHSLLFNFSVQIFTVPTLTLWLVKEMNLLEILLGCLERIFVHCSGEDGRLQASKWESLYEIAIRVFDDIQFVMNHNAVAQYITYERRDIAQAWMKLVSFIQGICPLKRETHLHVEEDDEHVSSLFNLAHTIFSIHSRIIDGASSAREEAGNEILVSHGDEAKAKGHSRHTKAGRLSKQSSATDISEPKCPPTSSFSLPSSVSWLISESLWAIELWLEADVTFATLLPQIPISSKRAFPWGKTSSLDRSSGSAFGLLSFPDWPSFVYDVSSQDVSVHVPLHRFFSLILQDTMKKLYGELGGACPPSFSVGDALFESVLKGCHPKGFSAFLMEHPLRNRVFCAQVLAGMWRKNGDTALIACEEYRSVRGLEQSLELDLFLLQCCAALAPCDLYVNRIVERFGLSDFLSLNLIKSNEYEPFLLHQMLVLIIQVVQERRFSGATPEENLKRELVCKLAVKNCTHSQLMKFLPHDLSKLDKFQQVLDDISVYSNPSGFNEGMYSLESKDWQRLDLYHPRWTSRNLQDAEERYMHYCGVSALIKQLPRWTKVYPPLIGISRIPTSKVVLEVIRAVLYHAVFSKLYIADGVVVAALHLLSLALDTCVQMRQEGSGSSPDNGSSTLLFAFATEKVKEGLSSDADEISLISLLVSLFWLLKTESLENMGAGGGNFSSLVEMLLKKFSEMDPGCALKLQILAPDVVVWNPKVPCSSFESEKRKTKARERQAAVMEKMRTEQAKFLSSINSTMLNDSKSVMEEITSEEGKNLAEPILPVCCLCHDHNSINPISFFVLLQKSKLLSLIDRSPPSWDQTWRSDKHDISARNNAEKQSVASDFTTVSSLDLVAAFGTHSPASLKTSQEPHASNDGICGSIETWEQNLWSVLCKEIHDNMLFLSVEAESQNKKISPAIPRVMEEQPLEFTNNDERFCGCASQALISDGLDLSDSIGVHLSSCGHAVHPECHERYVSSLKERFSRTPFEGFHVINPYEEEFLCPFCRGLANSILPSSSGSTIDWKVPMIPTIGGSSSSVSLRLQQAFFVLHCASNVSKRKEIMRALPRANNERQRREWESVSETVFKLYFPEKSNVFSQSLRQNDSVVLWDILVFSLASMEISARSSKTTLDTIYARSNLFRELKTPTGSVLSSVLKFTSSSKSEHELLVQKRFCGIQHFAGSICFGVSVSSEQSAHWDKDDNVPPGTNFWNRASQPVLAHDPFSSLMWCLFCLPQPILSCKESLLSLVHIFHAVSITQAVIAYSCENLCEESQINFHESLLTDISDALKNPGWVKQFFVLKYKSADIGDVVRRTSFSYLRRCALLWKLLSGSVSPMFNERDHSVDGVSHVTNDVELGEIEELECTFRIPHIDDVLHDPLLRCLGKKWIHHFCSYYGSPRVPHRLQVAPVVPLKLVQLPHLYQDLLQRYIKQHCADCKKVIVDPLLCLLCGKLCCPKWNPCCRKNEIPTHAMSCGAGTGVFLFIKRTTILLQRCARQAFWQSPYLDAFGEKDVELRRGKPLYLNEERYATLTYLVASHGFDRCSKFLSQANVGPLLAL